MANDAISITPTITLPQGSYTYNPKNLSQSKSSEAFRGKDAKGKAVIIKRGPEIENEREIIIHLSEDNIVDFGKHEDTLYLILDFVPGLSLAELIQDPKAHRLENSELFSIVAKLLKLPEVLKDVYQIDIHPGNLIFDETSTSITPIDFGTSSLNTNATAQYRSLIRDKIGNGVEAFNIYSSSDVLKDYQGPFLYNTNTELYSFIKVAQSLAYAYYRAHPDKKELLVLTNILEEELKMIANMQNKLLTAYKVGEEITDTNAYFYNPAPIRTLINTFIQNQTQNCKNQSFLPADYLDIATKAVIKVIEAELQSNSNNPKLTAIKVEFENLKTKVEALQKSTQSPRERLSQYTQYKRQFDHLNIDLQPMLSKERKGFLAIITSAIDRFMAKLIPAYRAAYSEELLAKYCGQAYNALAFANGLPKMNTTMAPA